MFEAFILSFINSYYYKALLVLLLGILCSVVIIHVIIFKKEPRSAVGWFVFVLSAPILGSIGYFFFGINRIQRKAVKLNLGADNVTARAKNYAELDVSLRPILKVGESLAYSPFCSLDAITPYNTGDEAYPKMLEAITNAKVSISLFSYIFKVDQVGQEFIQALGKAKKRGVTVCVLVDGVGSQATLSELSDQLNHLEIDFHVFLPVLWRPNLVNMRNHRKILVVDANIAFTGGMNIAEIYWPSRSTKEKVLDFHFGLKGPIVNYIQAVFADDWYYCSKEILDGPTWFRPSSTEAETSEDNARVVVSGPGYNNEKVHWHFISQLNRATKNIRISSPYFLPLTGVSTALIAAAQRGVEIDVVVPELSDHALVTWATEASMEDFLKYGCRIWLSPPPFDHSKLFVIDDLCTSIGSANWDARSLRLNYEMNIEIYSKKLSEILIEVFESKKNKSRLYTMSDYKKRSMFKKIRGGLARMASPYL